MRLMDFNDEAGANQKSAGTRWVSDNYIHENRTVHFCISWYLADMLNREPIEFRIRKALKRSRVVALVGPRQSGKTTLAREFVKADSVNYFDLEDPAALARLAQPMVALAPLKGIVVIDEIQRSPDLFPVLRVLADRKPLPARFLVLGSASPALLQQSSESLAGRLEVIDVAGLSLSELGATHSEKLWHRGGFPRSYLARSDADSLSWRQEYIRTIVERDLPQLGSAVAPAAMRRFWSMLAHYHGQIWSASEPARSLGVSEPTVRRYLDLLTGAYLARQLPPWHENLAKRQVKAPKAYVRDCGLLHALLGIASAKALLEHPKSGASWEGYIIEEVLKALDARDPHFWATHQGAELDLLLFHRGRRIGIEIKRADAPLVTKSMHIALADLKLDRLLILYPGKLAYALGDRVDVLPVANIADWTPNTRL